MFQVEAWEIGTTVSMTENYSVAVDGIVLCNWVDVTLYGIITTIENGRNDVSHEDL
jgi:hypothetical protein